MIINTKGIRIAFVNATYGTNSYRGDGWPKTNILGDTQKLGKALETADTKADLTVALVHWGSEYILEHGNSQEQQARWLAENGADIIIGSHPHVVQDTEVIKTKDKIVPVVYSLGNSVSNMSAENTQVGLMTTLQIVRHGNGDLEILDLEHKFTWCSRPGGYGDSYHVLPPTEYMGTKEDWKGKWEYEKMVSTYRRVSSMTGIKETIK